jgi:hypothetical protein
VLLRRLLALLQNLLQLRAGVVLEDLQAVEHLHVVEDLLAQEGLIELFLAGVLQGLLGALHALLPELLLDAKPVALAGLSLASLLAGLLILLNLPLRLIALLAKLRLVFLLLPLLLLLAALLLLPLALLVLRLGALLSLLAAEGRSGLTAGRLLQSLDELLVILGDSLRKLFHLIVLRLLLGELGELDLAPIIHSQPLGDILVRHALLAALPLAPLLALLALSLELLPLLLQLALLLLHFLPLTLLFLILLADRELSHAKQGQGRDAQREHPFGGFQHPDFSFVPLRSVQLNRGMTSPSFLSCSMRWITARANRGNGAPRRGWFQEPVSGIAAVALETLRNRSGGHCTEYPPRRRRW